MARLDIREHQVLRGSIDYSVEAEVSQGSGGSGDETCDPGIQSRPDGRIVRWKTCFGRDGSGTRKSGDIERIEEARSSTTKARA